MNKKKKIWSTILIVALLLLIAVLGYIAWYFYQDYKARMNAAQVQEQVIAVSEPAEEEVEEEPEEPELTEEELEALGKEGEATEVPDSVFVDMENPIDFKELKNINEDLYAWLQIDDTRINYPIAQRKGDDGFYLHHDMYGDAVFAGCLYTEHYNKKDWQDPLTIVYGHNMRNQTMFYDLHKFEDQTFFDEHPYFYIYTKDSILVYEVFAAYNYDDRRVFDWLDFSEDGMIKDYIDAIYDGSLDGYQGGHTRPDVKYGKDARVVTLQTCVGSGGPSRYLVQGILISEGGKVVEPAAE